jgi:hypothetical protein
VSFERGFIHQILNEKKLGETGSRLQHSLKNFSRGLAKETGISSLKFTLLKNSTHECKLLYGVPLMHAEQQTAFLGSL